MSKGTVNRLILIGNVGTIESRDTSAGTVVNMSVATTETIKGEDITQWHRVSVFGKVAEAMAKYCGKGNKVFVSGRLQTREYTDKEGNKKLSVEVVANEVQLLNRVESSGSQPAKADHVESTDYDDDIPF